MQIQLDNKTLVIIGLVILLAVSYLSESQSERMESQPAPASTPAVLPASGQSGCVADGVRRPTDPLYPAVHHHMETDPKHADFRRVKEAASGRDPLMQPLPSLEDMVTYATDIPTGPEPSAIEEGRGGAMELAEFDDQILGGRSYTPGMVPTMPGQFSDSPRCQTGTCQGPPIHSDQRPIRY